MGVNLRQWSAILANYEKIQNIQIDIKDFENQLFCQRHILLEIRRSKKCDIYFVKNVKVSKSWNLRIFSTSDYTQSLLSGRLVWPQLPEWSWWWWCCWWWCWWWLELPAFVKASLARIESRFFIKYINQTLRWCMTRYWLCWRHFDPITCSRQKEFKRKNGRKTIYICNGHIFLV